jgi:hypothetical protein
VLLCHVRELGSSSLCSGEVEPSSLELLCFSRTKSLQVLKGFYTLAWLETKYENTIEIGYVKKGGKIFRKTIKLHLNHSVNYCHISASFHTNEVPS